MQKHLIHFILFRYYNQLIRLENKVSVDDLDVKFTINDWPFYALIKDFGNSKEKKIV